MLNANNNTNDIKLATTNRGTLTLGGIKTDVAILEDGTRAISIKSLYQLLNIKNNNGLIQYKIVKEVMGDGQYVDVRKLPIAMEQLLHYENVKGVRKTLVGRVYGVSTTMYRKGMAIAPIDIQHIASTGISESAFKYADTDLKTMLLENKEYSNSLLLDLLFRVYDKAFMADELNTRKDLYKHTRLRDLFMQVSSIGIETMVDEAVGYVKK